MKKSGTLEPACSPLALPFWIVCFLVALVPNAGSQPQAEAFDLNMPAQALGESLMDLSRETGLAIVAPSSLLEALNAPALEGQYTLEDALDALLLGSGLVAIEESDGTYVVRRGPSSAAPGVAKTPATPASVEEILIYGTKQAIGLQDSVESVAVFTAERFDRENLFNTSSAVSRTPNVSVIGEDLGNMAIRGINRQGIAGTGLAINVFQDGVPLTRRALRFGASSAWDIEQLEVLRGSQSTVQGRNSIAGAVVTQSKKPAFEGEGAARARIAEFGTTHLAGAISGPIVEDQLAFRLSVDSQETDGYIDDGLSDEPFDFNETLTIRGRLLLEPDALSELSALVTVEYNDLRAGGSQSVFSLPGDLDFDPTARETFFINDAVETGEWYRTIADINYDFSDSFTLYLLGSYEDAFNRGDRTRREPDQPVRSRGINQTQADTYQAEVRLEFDFGALTGFIGGYYFKSDSETPDETLFFISDLVPLNVSPPDSFYRARTLNLNEVENHAFFTSLRYEPSDKWTLDFSLRYDQEQNTFERTESDVVTVPEDCELAPPGSTSGSPTGDSNTVPCSLGESAVLPVTPPRQSDDFGALLPSGSVTYHITADVSVFASYRRGYRAGGTFLSPSFTGPGFFEVVSYDPEFLDTFEAGWRSQWLQRRLTINGNLFYSEYKDQQVSFTDDLGIRVVDNAGATSLYGLELSASFAATPEFSITAGLGLLESRVDDYVFQPDDPGTPENELLDLAGNELGRSPKRSLDLGAYYDSQNGFFAGASLSYQSSYYADIFNLDESDLGSGLTEKVDAAAIVNAQVGFSFPNAITITAYVNNLLDEDSPESINIGAADAALGLDDLSDNVFSYTIRQPRTFGVTVDARF
ncbi:MAG: TonB-dependent receptor [Pseudomonadota bacterium]